MAFKFKPAKGRTNRRKPGVMNKVESAYADHLQTLKNTGAILEWKYESVTLKLAKDLRWTADFYVQLPDGVCELHECKGRVKARQGVPGKPDRKEGPYVESQSLNKAKVAASLFPFRVVIVYPSDNGWATQEVEAA